VDLFVVIIAQVLTLMVCNKRVVRVFTKLVVLMTSS